MCLPPPRSPPPHTSSRPLPLDIPRCRASFPLPRRRASPPAARDPWRRRAGLPCGAVRAPWQQHVGFKCGGGAWPAARFFCVVKAATQPGEEPAVMAHSITVDPNPTPSRTGGDVVFQLGVKRVR
ncbi:hypothetical protein PVAP13_6KG190800 [Panicum virgatum]|uniref:Uncharacterized protein n=1 Tax=Panicum virgatum TaxID=38727 RepID=A0A8T0RA32_PANVG|nr:hypothetical protein PVAP13_6KG190800 [Panicum virgatum]